MIDSLHRWWTRRFPNWLRWVPGRQGNGYYKMLLLQSKLPIPFDWYLISFPQRAFIEEHVDEVEGDFKHWRMNITLKQCVRGGKFRCEDAYVKTPLFDVFRPDIMEHSLQRVDDGHRLVLSIGWLTKG